MARPPLSSRISDLLRKLRKFYHPCRDFTEHQYESPRDGCPPVQSNFNSREDMLECDMRDVPQGDEETSYCKSWNTRQSSSER